MNRTRRILVGLAALALVFGLAACSSSDDDTSSTPTPPTITQGDDYSFPEDDGSFTTVTVGASEFLAQNQTLGLQFWGTVSAMDNGFTRLNLTYSSLPDPATGDVLYALPIPDAILPVFMAKSKAADEETFYDGDVGFALGGTCAADLTTYVTMLGPDPSHDQFTKLFYGNTRINGTDPFVLDGDLRGLASTFAANSAYAPLMSGFSCADGLAMNDTGDVMIFTISTFALAVASNGNDVYINLPTPPALTVADIVTSGNDYRGWAEWPTTEPNDPNAPTTARTPLALTGDGTNLVGGPYADFANNVAGPTATLSIGSSGLPGIFDQSSLDLAGEPTRTLRLVASQLGGKVVLLGVMQDDNGSTPGYDNDPEDWSFVLLVQIN